MSTDVATYEEYHEVTEKVRAFQFKSPDQVHKIVMAFLGSDKNWTLSCRSGEYSLTFPAPKKPTKKAPTSDTYTATLTLSPIVAGGSGSCVTVLDALTINEGDWVVLRWADTPQQETVIMTDTKFRRQYR